MPTPESDEVAHRLESLELWRKVVDVNNEGAAEWLRNLQAAVEGLQVTDRSVAGALDEDRRWMGALQAAVEGLQRDVVSLHSAFFDLRTAHLALTERLEFVRKELMYELRYAAPVSSGTHRAQARVVRPAALDASPLRLNVGCGHLLLDGFVNVDGRELPGVDVVADAGDLPLDPASVDHIHSAHLLEHFPPEELKRLVLPHWFALLRPGGEITAVVPDADTMLAEHAAGRFTFDELRQVTFGDQEYEGDFHFTMFSHESIVAVLREAGFDDVDVVADARRNGVCYEMEVRGVKPHGGAVDPTPDA